MEFIFFLVLIAIGYKLVMWGVTWIARTSYQLGYQEGLRRQPADSSWKIPPIRSAYVRPKDAPSTGKTIVGKFDN